MQVQVLRDGALPDEAIPSLWWEIASGEGINVGKKEFQQRRLIITVIVVVGLTQDASEQQAT
jgi:hypothetical protein